MKMIVMNMQAFIFLMLKKILKKMGGKVDFVGIHLLSVRQKSLILIKEMDI